MRTLAKRTLFITGASRGIGRAIALRAARDGANIVIAAKTDRRHPKLPGTIHSVAEEVEAAGGRALPLKVDIRDEARVKEAVDQAVAHFGGLDALVNNASAIWLKPAEDVPMKRYDLMFDVNVRGSFLCARTCIPHLRRSDNPHILTLSPPINLDPRWFQDHTAYTASKYAMSMMAVGLAAELKEDGIASNALWPRTVINTAALAMLGGLIKPEQTRQPEIMADAAHAVLTAPASQRSGACLIDEEVLKEAGVRDFNHYAVDASEPLTPDLFL
ncbi:SDR family oxidoreductase [Natronospira sp.]|uniref:SDR family oxidoreductase n=1 Tax=Natronospira sp. TaxID=2024970 RepID=UPI003872BFDC